MARSTIRVGLAGILWLLLGCSHTTEQRACSAALDKVATLDEAEGNQLIASGACDAFERVEDCPAYAKHRARYDAIAASLEVCRPKVR